jgi:hypothetical protein
VLNFLHLSIHGALNCKTVITEIGSQFLENLGLRSDFDATPAHYMAIEFFAELAGCCWAVELYKFKL